MFFRDLYEPGDNRRRVVAFLYGMFVASLLIAALSRIQGSMRVSYIALVPLVAVFMSYRPVYQFTRRFATQPDGRPGRTDEREVRVLQAAMMKSYQYPGAAVMIGIFRMKFASDGLHVWRLRTGAAWNLVLISFLIITQSVSRAIITWNGPDAEADEAEGAMNLRSAS